MARFLSGRTELPAVIVTRPRDHTPPSGARMRRGGAGARDAARRGALVPGTSSAGTYQVSACPGSTPLVNNSWKPFNNNPTHLETRANCGTSEITGDSRETSGLAAADIWGWALRSRRRHRRLDLRSAVGRHDQRDQHGPRPLRRGPGMASADHRRDGNSAPRRDLPIQRRQRRVRDLRRSATPASTQRASRSRSSAPRERRTTGAVAAPPCTARVPSSTAPPSRSPMNSHRRSPRRAARCSRGASSAARSRGRSTVRQQRRAVRPALCRRRPGAQQELLVRLHAAGSLPESSSSQFSLNTSALSNGPHEIQGAVVDAAGNQTLGGTTRSRWTTPLPARRPPRSPRPLRLPRRGP